MGMTNVGNLLELRRIYSRGITGKGITTAVLDTGIYAHPDFFIPRNKIVYFQDFIRNRKGPFDDNGHGTHVSGIIASGGRLGDGSGIGVAPESGIVMLKVLEKDGSGKIKNMLKGMEWILLNHEKYGDTIEKVIGKGSTPAGMHISICVKEILEFLDIKPGQIGLDATLGYGGHTLQMLKKLDGKGHIYGLDIDPIEIKKTTKRLADKGFGKDVLTTINTNFRNIDQVAKEHGPFDFILADLGVSSMQIDNPERGFTYKYEGPLDLRLNPEKGISAAERLRDISVDELEGMFIENSDEPYAYEIAKAIVARNRTNNKIETTTDLKNVIEKALCVVPQKERKEAVKKSCARVFQALRIDVNNEFEVLYDFLEKLPDALASGGRVAVLTFHSGEDRLVKKSFKQWKKEGLYSEIAKDVIRPSKEECFRNSRAKCTKMRWAIRSEE